MTRAGTATTSLVETVDLYPTLCELAGLPAPAGLDGASVVATLNDPAAATKDAIFHVYPRGQKLGVAVRTARHRLVEWKTPQQATQPSSTNCTIMKATPETKNLAAVQPEVVARLQAILATSSAE